jgi:molybdopterin molybdotransferase
MEIEIQIVNERIGELQRPAVTALGAWAEFRGLVRGEEGGAAIGALEYEAYSPMAEREIRRLLTELAAVHPCLAARVIHRVGDVPVGEAAIYVGIAAKHRAEAFALLASFMDRLKQDVPIWKRRAVPASERSSTANTEGSAPRAPKINHPASASEVVTLLRELCRPLEPERVALADAAGRVLREAACAPEDQPPFDRSSMDGYAVRVDDRATQFLVVDEIRAGDWKPRALRPGEAVRIATGGALPGDGLQVVMKEDVRMEAGTLTVVRRDEERNIRFHGEDARAGEALVEAGTLLQPGTVGLLASLGCARPLVTRLPRVLHIATGNEIVPPGQSPGRGQIRDSNSSLVRAFFGRWDIVPEQLRVGEDEAAIQPAISRSRSAVDLLLVSGGASVGEHDFTRRLLEQAGFAIHVSKTTARPGKPLIVAQRGNALAFGLPGNPLAHFVCLHLYVRAALRAWSGQGGQSGFQAGVLAADLPAGGNARETFWPAHWRLAEGTALLTPLRWSSSGDLTALATANALIRVTAGADQLERGGRVEFVNC